jgi:hypothetical protein
MTTLTKPEAAAAPTRAERRRELRRRLDALPGEYDQRLSDARPRLAEAAAVLEQARRDHANLAAAVRDLEDEFDARKRTLLRQLAETVPPDVVEAMHRLAEELDAARMKIMAEEGLTPARVQENKDKLARLRDVYAEDPMTALDPAKVVKDARRKAGLLRNSHVIEAEEAT